MLNCRFFKASWLCIFSFLSLAVAADTDYPPQIKITLEQRCMVCHGCYDAPCQLKLDAWKGFQRGASKDKVYDGTRLLTAKLTRLFEDAHTTEEWRGKGFYPVLNENQPEQGVAYRMLELKRQHPLPAGEILPANFDFQLDRDQQCPKPEEFERFATDYPLWGMPYGFPGLSDVQHRQLSEWLANGSPGVPRPTPGPREQASIERWEAFFNGSSLKEQLASRYIYEHLFLGNLYFSDLPDEVAFYNLVRSRTPPGEPIDIIATRRPYDSPGKGDFYYRLQSVRTSVLDKRHMPYALSDARMARWRELFLQAPYTVSRLPGYEPEVASNPFVAFRELPVQSRYEFMLDEAQFTIMGYIKGPVCRGQVALNVIEDHFWVVFTDPNLIDPDQNAEFLARESDNMRLPSGNSGLIGALVEWRQYARGQRKFLKAKSRMLEAEAQKDQLPLNLDLIWDGDGHNDNAALTIFRHNDSASVVKGLVGQVPKTAWVIGYSLLERIHYLLVAGFDVYGNVAHQLETRRYMDFLRMEGEFNFLVFMPEDKRVELRDFWYREASPDVKEYVLGRKAFIYDDSRIEYKTNDPKREFFTQLEGRLPGASAHRYQPLDPRFAQMQRLTGKSFSLMPEVAFVHVVGGAGGDSVYTIIHNSAYLNNTQLFREEARRLPVEDYLTVVKGFIGSYPNLFFQLPASELGTFVAQIETMQDEQDYARLVSDFGVRRTSPDFWQLSDTLYDYYRQASPAAAGLFDLNRYENR
ncbi:MAG: fatty acid cis/trans isomerase [Halieaceae bacterium]|nr:fatty acid cis/trans isomerase [Halieaceae bacterium]